MELMLIVWLVSILSNIKLFVSSYTVVCVIIIAVVYVLSKARYTAAVHRKFNPTEYYQSIRDHSYIEITRAVHNLPIGRYLIDKHTDYAYLSGMGLDRVRTPVTDILTGLGMGNSTIPATQPDPIPYLSQVKTAGYVAISMIVASVLLPSDTTMKYMAGAYLVQSVYESDLVQSAAPIARDAVNNQLKLWAKDTPDMDVLVRQAEQAAAAVKVVEDVGPTVNPSK